MYSDLADQKHEIEKLLKAVNKVIIETYSHLPESPTVEIKSIQLTPSWAAETLDFIEPLVTYGLRKAFVASLVSDGRIAEAAFTKLMGLPP